MALTNEQHIQANEDKEQPTVPARSTPERSETLEERSRRECNEAMARRDAAYISDDLDDFWGFGG